MSPPSPSSPPNDELAREVDVEELTGAELAECWPLLDAEERQRALALLPRREGEDLFLTRATPEQAELILGLPADERRAWLRLLPPDDAADLVQHAPPETRSALLDLLDPVTRREVGGLLAYADDEAGGLMNPHYARLRPDMSVAEAIAYLHRFAREHRDGVYYAYVLDPASRLLGTASFRELFAADPGQPITDVMRADPVTVPEHLDQEEVSKIFSAHHFLALPVVDDDGRM